MKNTIFLMAGLAGLSFSVNAQKLAASKVPSAVKVAFSKIHPEVKTVLWEKEKANYEAGFTSNGKEISELYTPAGMMTESEIAIKPADLPAAVNAYIALHYKGVKIKEAAIITKANSVVVYEAELNGRDVFFDAKGNPVI